jgi:hypothetical protein
VLAETSVGEGGPLQIDFNSAQSSIVLPPGRGQLVDDVIHCHGVQRGRPTNPEQGSKAPAGLIPLRHTGGEWRVFGQAVSRGNKTKGTMVQHKVPTGRGQRSGDGPLAESHCSGRSMRTSSDKSGPDEDRGAQTVGVGGAGEQRLSLSPGATPGGGVQARTEGPICASLNELVWANDRGGSDGGTGLSRGLEGLLGCR